MIIPTHREYWLLGTIAAFVVVILCGAVVSAGLAIKDASVIPETADECRAKLRPGQPNRPETGAEWDAALERCRDLGEAEAQ